MCNEEKNMSCKTECCKCDGHHKHHGAMLTELEKINLKLDQVLKNKD